MQGAGRGSFRGKGGRESRAVVWVRFYPEKKVLVTRCYSVTLRQAIGPLQVKGDQSSGVPTFAVIEVSASSAN